MANFGLWTSDDTSRREDLLDILKDVSPNKDNWCFDNFGTSIARDRVHQWLTFNVARKTANNNIVEGSDFADSDNSQPVRSSNLTAIFKESVRVSGSEQAVRVGLPGNPMDFQKVQALAKLKNQVEFTIINGTRISGVSGTAQGMTGLLLAISSNASQFQSGFVSLSTTTLENMHQRSWDAVGATYVADTMLVTMLHKRKIATFSQRVTLQSQQTDAAFQNVTVYDTSSGTLQIVPHKDLPTGQGTVNIVLINKAMFKLAWLRRPAWQEIAKVGDADRGNYIGEGTLESLAEKTSVLYSGFNTTD